MARGGGRGGDRTGGGNGGRGGAGGGRTGQNAQSAQTGRGGRSGAPSAAELEAARASGRGTTIDALFPALVMRETRGAVWTWDKDKKALTRVNLRLGISDGQNTQLIEGDGLTEGSEVVTNIITAAAVRPGPNQQQGNPFFQGPGGGRGPGGGGNRGGGGGRGF